MTMKKVNVSCAGMNRQYLYVVYEQRKEDRHIGAISI